MKRLHKNECGHPDESYLGSDDRADYYLYNEAGISICKRTGKDGEYQTITYGENNPKHFIKTLTHIEGLYKDRPPYSDNPYLQDITNNNEEEE
jgi:hypothetical protein